MFNKKLKIIIFFLPRITRMTTCIVTVEPRAKVAHTALLHECARYFADDRCWCTIGPRTLGASGSGDVARRTVCCGRGDQAARALWSARLVAPSPSFAPSYRAVRLTSRAFRLTCAVHSCVAVDLVQDVPLVLLPRRAHHHVRVSAPSVPASARQSDPAT